MLKNVRSTFINYLTYPAVEYKSHKAVFVELFIAFFNATIKFRPLFVLFFSSGQILFQFDNISSCSSEPRTGKNLSPSEYCCVVILVVVLRRFPLN